ncbi:MAG TPA: GPW/gp25 family protein [Candidatus Dormibacteraeota bacterium]|nr:GPW/gp25 family protein [Candidatus Dormibacteraeota bacterium]
MNGERFLAFPLQLDGSGRTATITDEDQHIRDMIRQLIFTDPGERVMRPDFGCGIRRLVFMPNSDALAAATQLLVRGSLQTFLGEDITVQDVQVDNRPPGIEPPDRDAILQITVSFTHAATGEGSSATFGPPALGRGQ